MLTAKIAQVKGNAKVDCYGKSEVDGRLFSKRLRAEREQRGWSQADMAERLSDKDIPMHWTTIAKIEAGDRSVRIAEAVGIADLFEVSLDALLGRSVEPKNDERYAARALHDAVVQAPGSSKRSRPRCGTGWPSSRRFRDRKGSPSASRPRARRPATDSRTPQRTARRAEPTGGQTVPAAGAQDADRRMAEGGERG